MLYYLYETGAVRYVKNTLVLTLPTEFMLENGRQLFQSSGPPHPWPTRIKNKCLRIKILSYSKISRIQQIKCNCSYLTNILSHCFQVPNNLSIADTMYMSIYEIPIYLQYCARLRKTAHNKCAQVQLQGASPKREKKTADAPKNSCQQPNKTMIQQNISSYKNH